MPDEQYGKNQIVNPSFQTNDLTGWTSAGTSPTIITGGTEPGTGSYCVCIPGSLSAVSQEASFSYTPLDLAVEGDFLPSKEVVGYDIPGYIIVTLTYGDGTKDEIKLPCRVDGQGGAVTWV